MTPVGVTSVAASTLKLFDWRGVFAPSETRIVCPACAAMPGCRNENAVADTVAPAGSAFQVLPPLSEYCSVGAVP